MVMRPLAPVGTVPRIFVGESNVKRVAIVPKRTVVALFRFSPRIETSLPDAPKPARSLSWRREAER